MPSCKSFAVLVVDSATCALLAGSDSENWVGVAVMAAVVGKVDPNAPLNADDHCHCSPNQHVQSCSVRTWTLLPRFTLKLIVVGVTTFAHPAAPFVASSALDLSS